MRKHSVKKIVSYQNSGMTATILLFFSIIFLLLSFVWEVEHITREQCYSDLSASTREAMQDLEANFRNDRMNLRILASVVAEQNSLTSLDVSNYLNVYDVNSLISNIGILTPENTCIQLKGKEISADNAMDYQREVLLGEHISGLQPALTTSGSMVIRSFMPIRKNGKTIGLLYAEMSPSNIARAWSPTIYNGNCTFCIIDRTSSEFIVNNWNKEIHRLDDLNLESLQESLKDGKSAFRQIETEQNGTVYLSYMPMDLENWEIMVCLPREEVFAPVQALKLSITWFSIGIMILLIIYLGFMVAMNKRSVAGAKKQANIDVLTGLQNRNCYEAYCDQLKTTEHLVCVYLDANGLHEINNTKGHLAGDKMLRFIADTLKIRFGEDTVYRIGGDEFIAFVQNQTDEQMQAVLEKVRIEIERNHYHVSAGYCIGESEMTLKEMISTAETRMYEEKRKYYEKLGRPVRNQNQKEGVKS
ncbi:MAG: GGDEF domain-containing protein [Oscillospiraceae bacterium]|nr:GGDEF domain-containing protein [Oscillospiraceae bacterium]